MEPFLGQIQAFGFNFPPRSWAFCDGALLPIAQYTAVFSLLGTTFGGDGRTTFGLPELRGRSIVHCGNGPGLSNITWGEKAGRENITLNNTNLPSHNHTANLKVGAGLANSTSGAANNFAANTGGTSIYNNGALSDNMATGNVNIDNTGSNQPFDIRNPFLGIYVSIALQGVFPSRS